MATIPSDSLFSTQWHLYNTAVGQYDLNVVNVWDDYSGRGVRIMVMDDGFDYNHSDLAPNYDTTIDYDFGANDDDPMAMSDFIYGYHDNHGTAVMGIIGAAMNGTGVVGVAHGATLVGARMPFDSTQDQDTFASAYVRAMKHAVTNDIDVVNMSFGSGSSFSQYEGTANTERRLAALDNAIENGRDGLGLIAVKSAGNSRGRDVNHSESDSSSQTIIVAAVNRDGMVSSYSSYGPGVLVSGFGSPGGGGGQVVTTDRVGSPGYSSGDYTSTFNGTSAAAPMVAGVAALILDANDGLGWRDMQTIMAYTARHVGSAVDGVSKAGSEAWAWSFNGAKNWNGGGLHYSEDYGYGLVDARAATRLAESWTKVSTSANQKEMTLDLLNKSAVLPDGDTTGTTFAKTFKKDMEIERVSLSIDFDTTALADLEVYLIGPDGRERRMVGDAGGYNSWDGYFDMHSQASRGSSSKGEWSVRLVDDEAQLNINVHDIKINFFGAAASKNNTYIYTDEFSQFTQSTSLNDKNGGVDILNASAVSSDMTVNLAKGKGTIDGVAITIKGIESVYGGDGIDTLIGSKGGNVIAGGRGADILTGGKGADQFRYWTMQDSRDGAHDVIRDFSKQDEFNLARIDARSATDKNDKFKFIGQDDFDGVAGQLHFVRDKSGGVTYIEGDVNGDGVADFMIELRGLHTLKAGDFML